MSDGINNFGNIVWQLALCLLLVWIIVFLVLIRGIASLGKVVYITSTFPYALLTIMLIKGATLEGASDGIKYYLFPDFSKLYDLKIWSDAATQIFYALSACTGGLIAMASYNNFNNNTTWDSLIVPISNILTSIYAGFVIFSVLGYMANLKGVSIEDVAADGPGLVFVVYPEGLSTMTAAPLWSMLFFLMMIMLGLSSMFSMVECFFIALMDEFPDIFLKYQNSVIILRGLSIVVFYFMSLPMISNGGFYIFSLVDSYAGGFPLLIIGLLEITVISYIYGLRNFEDDIRMMIGKKPSKCFRYTWNIISPLIILVTIIAMSLSYRPPSLFNNTYIYPYWAEIFGWSIITFCLAFIPAYFVFYIAKDVTKILIQASKPLRTWGPAQERHRTGRYLTCCQEISQF